MTQTIHVVDYDPRWPEIFEEEARRIRSALGQNCLELHHIGSTSVPGLTAKPILDIILVVNNPEKTIAPLEAIGYTYKGEINIPFRFYFSKKNFAHLHVYTPKHPEIALNLLFRDFLRADRAALDAYANLKRDLLTQESSHTKQDARFSGYTLGKNAFIQDILEKAGFEGLCLRLCTHHEEWQAYHRIREELLFKPKGIVYDRQHLSLSDPHCTHFVLYKGTRIVSAAMIEFLKDTVAALRTVATETPFQGQGFATHLVGRLEKWARAQGTQTLKLHANLEAADFYRKIGYQEMDFSEDVSLLPGVIDLGKNLSFAPDEA